MIPTTTTIDRWRASRVVPLLLAAVATASCHTGYLELVRRGSAGVADLSATIDATPGFDGHVIPMPVKPFANCFDVVNPKLPEAVCSQRQAGVGYVGYAGDGADDAPWWMRDVDATALRQQLDALPAAYRTGTPTGDAVPVSSFVHLSDAQIREPSATLGGQSLSDTLDPLIPTFAHDYEQELFSAYFYEAIIRTINAERRAAEASGADHYRIPPSFMIHTGDAIDAGLRSEFAEFLARSDLLDIPWYSAVGNHDILGIGNLGLGRQRLQGQWLDYACTPIVTLILEYLLPHPRTNGQRGEDAAARREPEGKLFSLAPFALREICLGLDVGGGKHSDADRLMGDARCALMPTPLRLVAGGDHTGCDNLPSYEKIDGTATGQFTRAHCRGVDDTARVSAVAFKLDDCGNDATMAGYYPRRADGQPSVLNGFDLVEPPPPAGTRKVAAKLPATPYEYPGYYDVPLEEVELGGARRRLRMIVLNTASDRGASGSLCTTQPTNTDDEEGPANLRPRRDDVCAQLVWLRTKLYEFRGDLVMVFAHHQIWGIADPAERAALKEALFEHGNVIGYFAGHTHSPQLRVVEEACTYDKHVADGRCLAGGQPARRMWEIVAPSTLEFPQLGRQVTLFGVPGTDLAYFEILSFEPHMAGTELTYVERAQAGAKRDKCREDPKACTDGEPRMPDQHLTYARLWFKVPGAVVPPPP